VHKSKVMHESETRGLIGVVLCEIYVQNSAMKYGYARVSTDGQHTAAQVAQLTEAGAGKIFKEIARREVEPRTAPKSDRLARCRRRAHGDRLDRLAAAPAIF
jgi:hypothetical protein